MGDAFSNDVTPIDVATDAAEPNIALPAGSAGPGAIAITPDGKTAYVVNAFSNDVTPIEWLPMSLAPPSPSDSPRRHRHHPNGGRRLM